jgi:hypothetical protein
MMEEIWKAIEGYDGIYEVSNLGRVRSLDRNVPALNNKTGEICDYFRKGRILKQRKVLGGYLAVQLNNAERERINAFVHRLVAKAFVPGYFEGADVNHKDEDKHNNRADNLEWCDRQYNINYGTGKWRREKFNARPVEQLTMDGKHIAYHENASQAARAVGCDPSTIRAVCNGKHGAKNCQTAKGYRWRYKEETDN